MIPEYAEHVDNDERDDDDEGGEDGLLPAPLLTPQQSWPHKIYGIVWSGSGTRFCWQFFVMDGTHLGKPG